MAKRFGRPAIFSGKELHSRPAQGHLTTAGWQQFEKARKRLAKLATRLKVADRKWLPDQVSDGDVLEYLARGHDQSAAALAKTTKAR